MSLFPFLNPSCLLPERKFLSFLLYCGDVFLKFDFVFGVDCPPAFFLLPLTSSPPAFNQCTSLIPLRRAAAALESFLDSIASRDSAESQQLVALAADLSAGNAHVASECDALRARLRTRQAEIDAARAQLQEARAVSQHLSAQISAQRQRLTAAAPLRAELTRRAASLEDESDAVGTAFAEGQPDALPLDEWLRRYFQMRVSLHLAQSALGVQH